MKIQQKTCLKMIEAFIHVSNKHVIVVYMKRKTPKYQMYSCQLILDIIYHTSIIKYEIRYVTIQVEH